MKQRSKRKRKQKQNKLIKVIAHIRMLQIASRKRNAINEMTAFEVVRMQTVVVAVAECRYTQLKVISSKNANC